MDTRWFGLLFGLGFSAVVLATTAHPLSHVQLSHNQARLQRGAQVFVNYCAGCHALRYLRSPTLMHELGVTNLMRVSLPEVDATQWFGQMPPDLSLITKLRGSDWVYTYLLSFLSDDARPYGSCNKLVPETMMPNSLAPLLASHRSQRQELVVDLVSFLDHVAEPSRALRYRCGVLVMVYLIMVYAVLYALRRMLSKT